jgi:hypothetical protein
MPHYACMTCSARLRSAGTPAELVGALCPQCGCPLQPAADLADLVGSRLIDPPYEAGSPVLAPSHWAVAARMDEFIVRRAERLERRRAVAAAVHGLDGDDPSADAVAVALTPPRAER